MAIWDTIKKAFVTKKAPINFASGSSSWLGTGEQSQRGNLEQYLRAYGENPYLYAAVSRISQAFGENDWLLYQKKTNKEREKIEKHALIDLINSPNPQQTGEDLLELMCKYYLLTGKAFWTLQKEGSRPELWNIPSPWLKPVVDSVGNITSYHYERGQFKKDFKPEEIIPFVNTDPLNPTDGVGPAQPLGITLDTWAYATQWNRNYFYFGADPGVIVQLEGEIPQEEADRKMEQWEARHRGYGRAHRMTLISGATKVEKAGSTIKDMDFTSLLDHNRSETLAAFGMPYTMLGGTDLIQRGNAEVAQYTFARWILRPLLEFTRRKLNYFLVNKFGDNMELDFLDPTPENKEAEILRADTGVKGGWLTVNEARKMIGEEPQADGDVYLRPIMLQTVPISNQTKSIKTKSFFPNVESKDLFWKAYVKNTEGYEPKFMTGLKSMWSEQKTEALNNLKTQTVSRNSILIDLRKGREDYIKTTTPLLTEVLTAFIKSGVELIHPSVPHKQIEPVVSQAALEALRKRIGWAADGMNEETASLLSQALEMGYASGESIDQIADRIKTVFEFNDDVRAQRIARTEILMASNQGMIEGYRQSGVVKKVEWLTARDEKSADCPICGTMDGDIENIDEAPPLPASTHPNCRCVWLPVIEY